MLPFGMMVCAAVASNNNAESSVRRGGADSLEARLEAMERRVAQQSAHIERLESRLARDRSGKGPGIGFASSEDQVVDLPPVESPLDRAVREAQEADRAGESPLDRAVRELGTADDATASPGTTAPALGPTLRLIDISVDLTAAAGFSSEREEELQSLQGGGHDPRKRGFTLQGAEFNFSGAIDPHFRGETNVVMFIEPLSGETIVELEEAFFLTQSLPCGWEVKGGHFFTEFGRINQIHHHAWNWMDQPIVNTRMFGPDGLRAPGIRIGKLLNTPNYSKILMGVQNANGETAASFLANDEFFEERPIGGRPFVDRDVRRPEDLTYSFRWETSWTNACEDTTWLAGVSSVCGPNATGENGHTVVYGADVKMKWLPAENERGWPFLIWEAEVMARHYRADNFFSEGDDPLDPADDVDLPDRTLHDWGCYTQLLWGLQYRWAVGLRYEFAGGEGESRFAFAERQEDPFRDDRHRVSPLIVWYVSEFSRIRLQYNFDHAEHLDGDAAHSVWIGFEGSYGVHPAHKF
jgi:hypothetical protein